MTIAQIVRPRGVKGEVLAEIVTHRPERFAALTHVRLEAPDGDSCDARLQGYWFHRGYVVLKFEGYETIEAAARLRGWWVKVAREQAIPREEDEYFFFELIGCEVETTQGRSVGVVTSVMETGDVPLLVVEGEAGEELLIPFAREICPVVDVAAKRIVTDPPDGLLEINRPSPSA